MMTATLPCNGFESMTSRNVFEMKKMKCVCVCVWRDGVRNTSNQRESTVKGGVFFMSAQRLLPTANPLVLFISQLTSDMIQRSVLRCR